MYRPVIKLPNECSDAELEQFCELVSSEGQVNNDTLLGNVRRADRLCFVFLSDELAGVAAIKEARASYREKVTLKSKALTSLANVPHEFGYVVVAPGHRKKGVSKLLAAALLETGGDSIFATSTTDNAPMHRTLERYGFARDGSPWESNEHPDKQLALFSRLKS